MTTTTELTEVGQSVVANGIRTDYPEAGSGEDVVLIHGSGPGVTSYANWRPVIPKLAEDFHVVAPDMVGFGYADRPEGIKSGLDTWPEPDRRRAGYHRCRDGQPGRQQLRRIHRAADCRQAPGHPVGASFKLIELLDSADLGEPSHSGHWSMIERTMISIGSSATSPSASKRS